LLREGFAETTRELIEEKGADPQRITLEITESVFASNIEEVNAVLDALKSMGIRIALDDFGKEYSSLARERDMNFDYQKIDKYFVRKLLELDPGDAITGEIISIGHKMRHRVIAEGVETEEQLRYLEAHGCDMVQGHLIGRPLDETAALRSLEARGEGAWAAPT